MTAPLRILTWHVHGSYLDYLTRNSPHQFVLPVDAGRSTGYGGKAGGRAWGRNVHEVPADEVRRGQYDLILYQSHRNWEVDRPAILSDGQRRLPQVFLEHDPPRGTPTGTRHPVDAPDVLIVHCTHFNRLMWDCGPCETAVIDHGVPDPGHLWTGELERGLVVVNGLKSRGRRLGADIFERVRQRVPLDLVGMESEDLGGLGEIPAADLPAFAARYRFFFHPIRYTSLGLALLESMMAGLPVVGLATTELPTVIRDGRNGFVSTDEDRLVQAMRSLIDDHHLARRVGMQGRMTALGRYGIDRFSADWSDLFAHAVARTGRKAA